MNNLNDKINYILGLLKISSLSTRTKYIEEKVVPELCAKNDIPIELFLQIKNNYQLLSASQNGLKFQSNKIAKDFILDGLKLTLEQDIFVPDVLNYLFSVGENNELNKEYVLNCFIKYYNLDNH